MDVSVYAVHPGDDDADDADLPRGFDLGAGASAGLDTVVEGLRDEADQGDLDPALVDAIAWFVDWQAIVDGEDEDWTCEGDDDFVTAECSPRRLRAIVAAMQTLRARVPRASRARWDELTAFLDGCVARGATIALSYDPVG